VPQSARVLSGLFGAWVVVRSVEHHSVSGRAEKCELVGSAPWVSFFLGIVRPVAANPSLQGRPLGRAGTQFGFGASRRPELKR